MRLLLLRHGQTPANVRGELDTGAPGPGLTALGMAQADRVPAALSHLLSSPTIFASTLVRTQQTAAPLVRAHSAELVILPGAHEIEAGDLEMATDYDSYRAYLETCKAWGIGDRDRTMPGGTDGHAFFARFDASIEQVATATEAVVVSHAAAMRVWVAANAKNIEPLFVTKQELENTGLVVLEGSPAHGWELREWRGSPVGGAGLADESAEDPTGEGDVEALV